jgi:hypothetical protein
MRREDKKGRKGRCIEDTMMDMKVWGKKPLEI